ncbi:MAG: hypothetical protein A2Z34_11445 [Planctomycetes bacterium RBG_16_59_8]|nr:MAG: hypothetical protein A2Z34_11445 [Planctomycetes bacterium RBG_16_59_8]
MSEWKIERPRMKCGRCSRVFAELENYYSGIVEEAGKFSRNDFCVPCWDGSSKESLFSYWAAVVPQREERRREDINAVVEFFRRLRSREAPDANSQRVYYLTALILMRKRRLKLLRTETPEGRETMVLEQAWDGESIRVVDPGMGEGEIDAVKAEMEKLFNMEFSS